MENMQITESIDGNIKTFISSDENGTFKVTLIGFKKGVMEKSKEFQLQWTNENPYINLNLTELITIRDLLNEAIETVAPLGKKIN